MYVAIGYGFFPSAAGYHIERALTTLGHSVTYVGLPHPQRAGFDSRVSIAKIIENLPQMPDFFLWIDPAGPYFPPDIETLAIPTACYLIDVHLGHWRKTAAQFFDAVFIAQKDYLPEYKRAVGHNQVYWLPLAAATDVHYDWKLERKFDVGFVGNISRAHKNTARTRRLKHIADKYRTNDFYRFYAPEEVGKIYSQSKIVFNTSINGDVTMRLFEGTAANALVLTDKVRNGFENLFSENHEVAIYNDDDDLMTKIDYYLTHPIERIAIANAGHHRTYSEHTYIHRAKTLLEILASPTLENCAPQRNVSSTEQFAARRRVFIHLHMTDALFGLATHSGLSPWRRLWASFPLIARRILL